MTNPPVRSRRKRSWSWIRTLIGCLLIGAGLISLFPVVSNLWLSNIKADVTQREAVKNFNQKLITPDATNVPDSLKKPIDYGVPVVGSPPKYFETFGVVYIPRFGSDFSAPLVQGTGLDVLDTLGLGHYDDTAMPGEVGNFAIAGHRQTHGAVLDKIHLLEPGDKIYVQTKDGFYTYVFRNADIVLPSAGSVLDPVPMDPTAIPTERILTMTSCNPQFGSQERIIAYSTMKSWQPLSAGAPAEIASTVDKTKQ